MFLIIVSVLFAKRMHTFSN